MHLLLFLVVLLLSLSLARTLLGVLGIVCVLVLVLLAFLLLPWWLAVPAVVALCWLFMRDVQAEVNRRAATALHLREFERTAGEPSSDCKAGVAAQDAAFRLRSRTDD